MGAGGASADRDPPPKSLWVRGIGDGTGKRKAEDGDLHVGDTVTDDTSTSDTSSGTSSLSEQTGLFLLLHTSGGSMCHRGSSVRWVRGSGCLSGLLVRRARGGGRSCGRSRGS